MEGAPRPRSKRLTESSASNGDPPAAFPIVGEAGDRADLLDVAARLRREGTGFVLMTIVRAVSPTSGKPGDKAILTERGEWLGWIGGSCAEPTARRAARAALYDGQCRLLHLTNDETAVRRPGVEMAAMSCYSGGSLEIYVEPHRVEPALVVFGRSPIADALCAFGASMHYRVTHVDLRPEVASLAPVEGEESALAGSPHPNAVARAQRLAELAEPSALTFVVVASHGHFEEEALEWALSRDLAYVGLVSSRRRLPDVRARLTERGLGGKLGRLHAPAGLDIGASAPHEVALSVLSQIVAEQRGKAQAEESAGSCCGPRPAEPGAVQAAPALPPRAPEGGSCCS